MQGCVSMLTGRITAGLNGLFVAIVALSLSACVTGGGFPPPTEADLRIGQTTIAEVVQRFGPPYSRTRVANSAAVVNAAPGDPRPTGMRPAAVDGVIERLTYAHSASSSSGRIMALTFWNDRLVFRNFISSIESESTNFDEGKIGQIRRGATTASDLVALLGRPSGHGVYPAVANPGNRLIVYQFVQINPQNRSVLFKRFDVLVDSRDIVVDYPLRAVDRPVAPTVRR